MRRVVGERTQRERRDSDEVGARGGAQKVPHGPTATPTVRASVECGLVL